MLRPTLLAGRPPKWCAALLAVVACATACATTLSASQVFDRSAGSVVRVDAEAGAFDAPALGAGFFVAPGVVVTNLHVIDGAREAFVRVRSGERYPVSRVLEFDERHDLALLELDGPRNAFPSPLPLGDATALEPGARLYSIGSPLGFDYTIAEGLFNERLSAPRAPGVELLRLSIALDRGSSGGPLLNERGEVVGVATLTIRGGQMALAIPSDAVRSLFLARGARAMAFSEFARVRATRREVGAGRPLFRPRVRRVPEHPAGFLARCSGDARGLLRAEIEQAIQKGAPIYNDGDHESCFRIYEGMALRMIRDLETRCSPARGALQDGLARASELGSYDDKAWAMRDAMDGLINALGTDPSDRGI